MYKVNMISTTQRHRDISLTANIDNKLYHDSMGLVEPILKTGVS